MHAPNRALKFTSFLWFESVRFIDNDLKRPVRGEISVDPGSTVLREKPEWLRSVRLRHDRRPNQLGR
jgi:hypothetical protein